jgi:circadian clock protein KaiB
VVDVMETPLRALTDGVMLTPTLVRLAPLPVVKMVGDLSDTPRVRAALGMGGHDDMG